MKKGSKRDHQMAAANDKEGLENVSTVGEVANDVVSKLKSKAKTALGDAPVAPAKKKKLPDVVETKTRREVQVRYDFSDKELAEIAGRLTGRLCDISTIEDEKKSVMASYTDKLKAAKLDVSKLSRNHRDGFEMRAHECVVIYDYKKKEVRFKDVLSGDIVETRAFQPGDEQRRFV